MAASIWLEFDTIIELTIYVVIVMIVPLAGTLSITYLLAKIRFRPMQVLIPFTAYATWSALFFPGFFNTNPTWNVAIDPLVLAIATPALLFALAKIPVREPALSRFPLIVGVPSGIALGILVWAVVPPVQLVPR